ncbi:MAG: NGG1p interacting factor NIF3, partial [Candidatus Aminicenantes bacterium]|nr:NGG1p interacting factor NIF3 [Candidatus Aminicenantes bacterium]
MKLEKLYRTLIDIGIKNDPRGKPEVLRVLKEEKEKRKSLKPKDAEYYDPDRLFNPYSDSRLLNGSPETNVRRVIAGIDMEAPEILLAYLLNRDFSRKIDLVVAHHPEGYAQARLADVMSVQADILASFGVAVSVAEQLMDRRISEVDRRLMPVNHTRAVDAAKVLGLPMLCVHTPADNCVNSYLQNLFDKKKPRRLKDLVALLLDIPEYRAAAKIQVPPKIISGSENGKCGKVFVDMTGGTEGSKDIYARLSSQGVRTIVGMHMS